MHKEKNNSLSTSKLDQKQFNLQKDKINLEKFETANKENNLNCVNSDNLHKQDKAELDFNYQNRLVQIISLFSKGLTQQEISLKLGIHQSTVSRDLRYLREDARNQIWEYMNKEILFEYMRYIVSNNDTSERLWKIIDDGRSSKKEKISALTLLNQINKQRIEIMMSAPESYLSVKENIDRINELNKIQINRILKFTKELSNANNICFKAFKPNMINRKG